MWCLSVLFVLLFSINLYNNHKSSSLPMSCILTVPSSPTFTCWPSIVTCESTLGAFFTSTFLQAFEISRHTLFSTLKLPSLFISCFSITYSQPIINASHPSFISGGGYSYVIYCSGSHMPVIASITYNTCHSLISRISYIWFRFLVPQLLQKFPHYSLTSITVKFLY